MTLLDHLTLVLLLGAAPLAADPLDQLNAAFRSGYTEAKARSQPRGEPVLVVAGERLLLFQDRRQTAEAPIRPPLYHRLKAVAHVPLALSLMLDPEGEPPAPERLAALRALAAAARAEVADRFPEPDRARQERILDASLALLDGFRAGAPEPGRLRGFTRELGPLVLANAEAAAALELDQLDRAVGRFRQDLGPAAWSRARVVIIGAHMAREGEVSLQYFCRLLGEPGEGGRIVFAEGLWEPAAALDLLATHRVDAGVGAAFFDDPARMHRDLLADGAQRWLDGHRF